MRERHRPEDATLLDILIDGFEKNEIMDGRHWRTLPLRDEASAIRKFSELQAEARRWKGKPLRLIETSERRLAVWPDLEIRQARRGVMIRVRASGFHDWWHDAALWQGEDMGAIHDWLEEEPEP